jgi:hypothetical protein
MEQNTQKPPLPIKTKIAAWWLIIFSPEFAAGGLAAAKYIGLIGIVVPTLLGFFSGIFILIWKKKRAWWLAVLTLSITLVFFLISDGLFAVVNNSYSEDVIKAFLLPKISIIIPLIFLLIDRKNFFKIAL